MRPTPEAQARDFIHHTFPQFNSEPDLHTYRHLIRMYLQMQHQAPVVVELLSEMKAKGIEKDAVLFGELIRAYSHKGELEIVLTLLREAKDLVIPEFYLKPARRLIMGQHELISEFLPACPEAHVLGRRHEIKIGQRMTAKLRARSGGVVAHQS